MSAWLHSVHTGDPKLTSGTGERVNCCLTLYLRPGDFQAVPHLLSKGRWDRLRLSHGPYVYSEFYS